MKQKIYGVLLILISIAIFILAIHGTTPKDKDTTLVLFLIPLGIKLIITKENFIHGEN